MISTQKDHEQIQQQHKFQQLNSQSLHCHKRIKSAINIDCVKVCPVDHGIWALAFYQQMPEFCGGIQVVTSNCLLQESTFGKGQQYLELGPIMHIEWLNTNKQTCDIYYILAAARCDQVIVCSYQTKQCKLGVNKRVVLQTGVFFLYCDWRLYVPTYVNSDKLKVIAAASTNESVVYTMDMIIGEEIEIGESHKYPKHDYAVWACKINPFVNSKSYFVTGDQVDCLYLYDLNSKSLVGKNKTAHTQGICQIVWKNQNTILSGSFDGSLSEICIDNFTQTLKRIELGGTIWRIIPVLKQGQKIYQQLLICNSSQKKFQLIKYATSQQIWNSGQQHTSLAYAADCSSTILVTASFYDQEVRVWLTV